MYKIESFIAMGCAHSLHCEDDFYVYEDEAVSYTHLLDEKNEITLQEFKQKREEYFNEYKEYVQ